MLHELSPPVWKPSFVLGKALIPTMLQAVLGKSVLPVNWRLVGNGYFALRFTGVLYLREFFTARVTRMQLHFEPADDIPEALRLTVQGLAGSGDFFHHGGVILGRLVHLISGGLDFLGSGGLLTHGGGHFNYHIRSTLSVGDNLSKDLCGLLHQEVTAVNPVYALLDQGFDFFGRFCGPAGQVSDLGGDYCEPAALFAGTCRLHSGV